MRLARRANLTLLVAALLLDVLAGIAAANTLDMSETTFTAAWRNLTFSAAGTSVSCPVTLEGVFLQEPSGTIAKVASSTIARVTQASVGTCTGGAVTVLTETLPWSVRYVSYFGTLPNITDVNTSLVGASFQVRPRSIEVSCLVRTEGLYPVGMTFEREASSVISEASMNERSVIPLTGGFFCAVAGSASVSGIASVHVAGSLTPLDLYLERPPRFLGGAERGILDSILMREPVNIGQSVVKNYDATSEANDIRLSAEGANPELFNILSGAPEDCNTRGKRLRPNQGSTCTIRVEYIGRREQRTAAMTVRVEAMLGNNPKREVDLLAVLAQR